MPRVTKERIVRTVVIVDAPGEGWQVSVLPTDEPLVQDRWFARRDCARAFARGMNASATWTVVDGSTSRSKRSERAKVEAEANAVAQLDLFMIDGSGP
jgi:hypothetical protein